MIGNQNDLIASKRKTRTISILSRQSAEREASLHPLLQRPLKLELLQLRVAE